MFSSISKSSSSSSASTTSSTTSTDYHTQWCPVCDKVIAPKRSLVPVQPDIPVLRKKANARPRGFVEGTGVFNTKQQGHHNPARMLTIIEQGPFPLYCSEECKLQDIKGRHDDGHDDYYTYPLYGFSNSPSSDVESITNSDDSLPSPTDGEHPVDDDFAPPRRPFVLAEHRSKSHHQISMSSSSVPTPIHRPSSSSSSRFSSSLPSDTDELLSKFSHTFSKRSESRMSLYGCSPPSASPLSSSPRRERPLLPRGAEGKLAVPDVFVRVPSTHSIPSRPPSSRRNSSTSVSSNFSRTGSTSSFGSWKPSPLCHDGEFETEESDDEYEFDEPLQSPSSLNGYQSFPHMKRPVFETGSYSNDNFRTITPSSAQKKRRSLTGQASDSIAGSGKRLFLFPTD